MKKLVVLSGAGISAESGLKTFRDSGGLWEGFNVHDVATPKAWEINRKQVLDFYNMRRAQLKTVQPNEAHLSLADLEKYFDVQIVTQNVDDLHERAGSKTVLHLHGELNKVRSTVEESLIYHWTEDLGEQDVNELGHSLRPHIVWFGELVPEMDNAARIVMQADILLVIGTSLQVYPAASLVAFAKKAIVYYIDPSPSNNYEIDLMDYHRIPMTAAAGLKSIMQELIDYSV